MSAKKTLILAVVAVALLGAALWYSAARRPSQEAALQTPALPGLAERLPAVQKVTLTGAGDRVIATLEQGEDGWRLVEKDYPADSGALRTLLLGLAEAKRVQAKTAKPELYDRLGVEDVSAEDAQGVKLTIEGGGEPLAIIVGQNVNTGTGTYVRPAGEAQSWQIDRNVAVEKNAANWLQKSLTDIQPDRIASVSVSAGKDQVEIVASEADDGDFILANLPRGREPQSAFVADATAGFLQGLRIDDVAGAEAQPAQEPQRKAIFRTTDGLDIAVTSWEAEGKSWAQLQASLDEARAGKAIEAAQAAAKADWEAKQQAADGEEAGDAAGQGEEEGEEVAPEAPLAVSDPAAHREQRLATLREEVEALNARFAGHSFQLPTYKAGNLNRELEAYLKPKD
ncbi:DUF4340 domain-containing protein [Pseudomarimonas salicorniae]|uniref:DUF4340 domain-containing protein n=1 Tax=Pseudomarimonas salicorniae TaxID=2933270 RepID=A0ABT0GKI7_9GAMM|nr:DUF4340 domain-containing protein [Lysobacter sp. CAU 1642]MCK7594928.1 DUF4340 domain-containing protein [Lysobacter sp. CAU 1642]